MHLADFLFKHNAIKLQQSFPSWQAAVAESVQLLVRAGVCEPRYYDAIIAITHEHGPYYLIAPHIAMPHACPEDGALATGFSLLTLREPVVFGHHEHDPVQLILTVCAKNRTDLNESVLIEVMNLFDDDARIAALLQAETQAEVKKILLAVGE